MKKILLLLLFCTSVYGQWIKIPDKEYTTLTFGVDPYASFKEKGLNIIGEFTLISYFGYAKVGAQIFPGLTGGYYDITGGAGFNQESSISLDWLHIDWINFNVDTRLYQGIRLGYNYRAESPEYTSHFGPLFGLDLGVDFKLSESISIGGRFTNDWRDDMRYSGAEPKWVQSFFITSTFNFNPWE